MKRIATLFVAVGIASFAAACGGASQSDECKKYVECAGAVSPSTNTSTYGEDGTCWENSDTADACTAACTSALTSLKTAYPNESKCQ